jgi:hypothetical protein
MCQSPLKEISAKSAAIHTVPLPFVQGEIPIKCPMPRARLSLNFPFVARASLTAVVRKKLGLTLVSEKTGEERVYRVIVSDIPLKRKSRGHRVA